MQPTSNDISFNLFGFSTTIQPFFWLIAAILTVLHLEKIDDMHIWIAQILLGMTGVLLSILVHELGHAFVFRHVFHTESIIFLHGFGGATMPTQHYRRGFGFTGMIANCFLSFAGPLAGFLLAFSMLVLYFFLPMGNGDAASLVMFFLYWTAQISIIWGIFNLLPIYPMDGGHIFREFFLFFFPWQGVKYSLVLSITVAAVLAVIALQYQSFFITFLFGCFAYQNYQELTLGSFRR